MEPFRPFVDIMVWHLQRERELRDLSSEDKRHLASVLTLDLPGRDGVSPIQIWLDRLARPLQKSVSERLQHSIFRYLRLRLTFSHAPPERISHCVADGTL